jgi:hypothetical protein
MPSRGRADLEREHFTTTVRLTGRRDVLCTVWDALHDTLR